MRQRWDLWKSVAYTGISIVAVIVAYEATRQAVAPDVAGAFPPIVGSWGDVWPLALLLLVGGTILSLQRFGVLPYRKGRSPSLPKSYSFAWTGADARVIPVVGRKFLNETVLLDGHAYSGCTFENVTFLYNGTAIYQFHQNEITGSIIFASASPVVEATFVFLQGLDMLPKSLQLVSRWHSHVESAIPGHLLPPPNDA